MTHTRLTAETEDANLIQFTLQSMEEYDFRVNCIKGVRYNRWELETEDKTFVKRLTETLAENIRVFYKYRFLKQAVGGFSNPYRYHALLGVMIGVDRKSEREEITRFVRAERQISLPQIRYFQMDKIYEEWRAFAGFIAAFRLSDWDEKRVFTEVIPILQILGLNDDHPTEEFGVTLDGETGKLCKDGRPVSIPPLNEDGNLNLITALTAMKPDTVTVTNPKRLSREVLNTLQEMGQAEREAVNNS